MSINREAARDAGYSDAEIDQFEAEESKKSALPPAVETAKIDAAEPPPPSTTVIPEVEHNMSNILLSEAAIALGNPSKGIKDIAIPAGEGYLAYKGVQAWQKASAAKTAAAAAQSEYTALQKQKFAAQQAARGAPVQPAASPMVDAQGRPLVQQAARGATPAPMAPQAAPTAQNFIQRMAALGKQYAPAAARIGTGVGAMLYSPNLGPEVPETGPLRGSELNPKTHRLWTKEELAQYNQFYR